MHKPANFKYRVRAISMHAVLKLFAWLPLPVNHALGALIGWLIYLIPNRLRNSTQRNIELCFPRMSEHEQQQLIRSSLLETGKTLTEASPLWHYSKQRIHGLVKKVHGQELVERAFANGKGVIIAFPHLGTWELLSLYCSSLYPMTTLYKSPKMAYLDKLIRRGREHLGATLLPIQGASSLRHLYQALNKNQLVGILPDQEPSLGSGVFAPFFGIPAYSMTLVSRLARKTGATVLVAYTKRLPAGKGYEIFFTSTPAGFSNCTLEESVTYLNTGMEKCIRELPEQYQWSYKRFRTRPQGEQKVY